MELKEVLKTIENSIDYKEWRTKHPEAFLAHAFVMLDEENKNIWQTGYFDDKKNTMSTFVFEGAKISVIPDQEVLKAEQKILALKPEDVIVSVADALAAAQKARIENYGKEQPIKSFFIIQNIEAHGPVFNITFFTAAFKTINIKISTTKGKVVHHSMQALAAFG